MKAQEMLDLADAMEKSDWSGASIGNKVLLKGAIECLRLAAQPQTPREELAELLLSMWQIGNSPRQIVDALLAHSDSSTLCGGEARDPKLAALRPDLAVPQTPSDVVQHVAWLNQYIIGMDENNWKDMRLRAERQLDKLAEMIAQPQSPPQEMEQIDSAKRITLAVLEAIARGADNLAIYEAVYAAVSRPDRNPNPAAPDASTPVQSHPE